MVDLQIVGGVTWPAEKKPRCQVCSDSCVLLDDDDAFVDYCDCERGEAQRYGGDCA